MSHVADKHLLDWGVRVERSDDNLQLGVDSSLLLGIGTNERDGSDSFTVKTKVLLSAKVFLITYLGERLTKEELVALFNEVSNSISVLENVT